MIAAVSFDHITKRFPGVLALEDVSFSIAAAMNLYNRAVAIRER